MPSLSRQFLVITLEVTQCTEPYFLSYNKIETDSKQSELENTFSSFSLYACDVYPIYQQFS